MGGGNYCLAFFTPTYNRAHLLQRVYQCLLNQSNKNFCWIVINDGSSDNTDNVVRDILKENLSPVCYITKPYGGKHSAFECALQECQTDYFQCMDDDDIYDPEAVEFFLQEWKNIKIEGKAESIGAIRTLTRREDGTFVPHFTLPDKEIGMSYDATTLEMNYKKRLHQENWTCYDTQKLRSIQLFDHDYWLSDRHKFVSESIWQGRFARKYKCRYVNVAFREYRNDVSTSILRGRKTSQHYIDMFINNFIINNEQYDFLCSDLKTLAHSTALVSILRGYLRINFIHMLRHTTHWQLRLLYLVMYPLGIAGRWFDVYRNVQSN